MRRPCVGSAWMKLGRAGLVDGGIRPGGVLRVNEPVEAEEAGIGGSWICDVLWTARIGCDLACPWAVIPCKRPEPTY